VAEVAVAADIVSCWGRADAFWHAQVMHRSPEHRWRHGQFGHVTFLGATRSLSSFCAAANVPIDVYMIINAL
jgi:hypothetical protein